MGWHAQGIATLCGKGLAHAAGGFHLRDRVAHDEVQPRGTVEKCLRHAGLAGGAQVV